MPKHQIIYTSCKRGIDGINDGQQIFSYDAGFAEAKSDEVKRLFTYQVPVLPAGETMTEELAETMPKNFQFRHLDSGAVAITLNTYLGRDYMGSAGRFGNTLSHSIICPFEELVVYPCEIYGSNSLRSKMDFDEVNNPEPPSHLPIPQLNKGVDIDVESIVSFLEDEDNMFFFKQMAAAMLKFPEEKRRTIICDTTENIIMWIAALQYALPLEIAKDVNFSTYDYDPELSSSRICGVLPEGSKYNSDNYVNSNRHYVFDFINQRKNDVDDSDPFFEFLDNAFSFSFSMLTAFHRFLIGMTTYRVADENLCAAYSLYRLLEDGFTDLPCSEFERAMGFAEQFLVPEEKKVFFQHLAGLADELQNFDNSYALKVLGCLMGSLPILNGEQQQKVKQMVVDRLLFSLAQASISEAEFMPLYENIDQMAKEIGLSLPASLMQDENQRRLMQALSEQNQPWRVRFVLRIISEYVLDGNVMAFELEPEKPVGALYGKVLASAFAVSNQQGMEYAMYISKLYQRNTKLRLQVCRSLEQIMLLQDCPTSNAYQLWNDLIASAGRGSDEDFKDMMNRLYELKYLDRMYHLYEYKMDLLTSMEMRFQFFKRHWRLFQRMPIYDDAYSEKAVSDFYAIYEKCLPDMSKESLFEIGNAILGIISEKGIQEEYASNLADALSTRIPLEKPTPEDKVNICKLTDLVNKSLCLPLKGHLALLQIGLELEDVYEQDEVLEAFAKLEGLIDLRSIHLNRYEEKECYRYLDWISAKLFDIPLESREFRGLFRLLNLTGDGIVYFIDYCCEETFKRSRKERNSEYLLFAQFIRFIIESGEPEDQKQVAKYLRKVTAMNKQKLEDINAKMIMYFKDSEEVRAGWREIHQMVSSQNSGGAGTSAAGAVLSGLGNKFSGLFRK